MSQTVVAPTITLEEKRDIVVSLRLKESELVRVERIRAQIAGESCFRFMAPKSSEMVYNLFAIALDCFEKGFNRYNPKEKK